MKDQNSQQTNQQRYPKELLEQVPIRIVESEEVDGKIVLKKPKFAHPRLQTFLSRFFKKMHYFVHLDEMGTAVWRLIDNQKTVREIGEALHQELGEKAEPVYERLTQFVITLYRSKLIRFQ